MSGTTVSVSPVAALATMEDGDASRHRLGPSFWISVAWLAFMALAALLAPVLPLQDPDANAIQAGLRPPYPPSAQHWLGTDQDARDMLARTIYGARVSLTVGLLAMGLGLVVGGALGMLAGYLRGWWDSGISFLFVALLSFPSLIFAILVTALLERGAVTIAVTLGVLAISPVGQVARASTLSVTTREYVTAARAAGATSPRILAREILPNVAYPMAALALLGVAVAVVAEGGLAFLGLSVEKGSTWGKLILGGAGRRELETAPWIALVPIGALFLTVLALNVAGERVRDHFDRETVAV